MKIYSVYEAKTHFSKLIQEALSGQKVIVSYRGAPIGIVTGQLEGFLPIEIDHLALLKRLPAHHSDPFDRLIICHRVLA
jgi:antitoxin (DNA-binding transcriptional repressor) of toxin-antitoxin stability system